MKRVTISKMLSLGARPSVNGWPNISAAMLTTGIVSPIVASAEPSDKFKLICNWFLREARIAVVPSGNKTTWAMEGHNNFISKAMCLVMDMDKMIGPDFERGLASLKDAAESAAKSAAAPNP